MEEAEVIKRTMHISRISGYIVTTNQLVDIKVCSKNLILIGRNGSGKTSFLKSLFAILNANIVSGDALKLDEYKSELERYKLMLDEHEHFRSTVEHYSNLIEKNTVPLIVAYDSYRELIGRVKENTAVIRFYEAARKIAINKVTAATPLKQEIPDYQKDNNHGVNLEQHLVNLQVGLGLAMRRGDKDKIDRVDEWFDKFEGDLKFLFEDDSFELEFDDENLSFALKQHGRPPYTFQSLSSGYLAIFDIYADLLVRTQYYDVLPTELHGIVLIDEIDAHLHMSIQRKILPFFTRSFPNVQFLVSTHSPFVISSTDDSLIYDVSSGRACEDLSLFSLEHIVEGVIGVPPVSQRLQDIIVAMVNESNEENVNLAKLEQNLNSLAPHLDTLDDESKMFFEIAKNRYLTLKKGVPNV